MTYILAILAGVAGAAVGWLVTGFAAAILAGFFGMSDFEGGRAMFAFWGVAPLGAIAGLILGIVLMLKYRGKVSGFLPIAWQTATVAAAIGALAVLGIFVRLYTLPDLQQPFPRVVFEIRLPPDAVAPDKKSVKITLDTDKNQTDALLGTNWLTRENGRAVLHGFVDLYKRTTNRLLVLKIAGEPDRLFTIRLWGNPGPTDGFTPWDQVDYIGEESQIRRAEEKDRYEFRYRVERDTGALPLQGDMTSMSRKN